MQAHIEIEGVNERFSQVHDVRIESGNDLLTDICEIRLPAAIEGRAKQLEASIIPGRRVHVEIGYKDHEPQTFDGYVARTSPEHPFKIECTDATYLLHEPNLTMSWGPRDRITLAGIISWIIGQVNEHHIDNKVSLDDDLPDVRFDKFRLVNITPLKALEKLIDEYGLTAYFVPNLRNTLYVGLAFIKNRGQVTYDLYRNVISHSLTYRREEDTKLKVKAIGITRDNKRIESDPQGSTDGEERTIFRYNVSDKKSLNEIAKEEAKKLVYTGFEGSLTGFLIPHVVHGMTAIIKNEDYPEREGNYHVDRVISTFGPGGGRNEVNIGVKL